MGFIYMSTDKQPRQPERYFYLVLVIIGLILSNYLYFVLTREEHRIDVNTFEYDFLKRSFNFKHKKQPDNIEASVSPLFGTYGEAVSHTQHNYTESNIPLFIINLPQSKHRRDFMKEQLKGIKSDAYVVKAVNKNKINQVVTPFERERIEKVPNGPSDFEWDHKAGGTAACALSHLRTINYIAQNKIPMAVIMEDDLEVNVDMVEGLNKLVQSVKKRTPNFDGAWLASRDSYFNHHREEDALPSLNFEVGGKHHDVFLYGNPIWLNQGAMAYILTLEGAQHAMEQFRKGGLTHAVDFFLMYQFAHRGRFYSFRPPFVKHLRHIESDLGNDGNTAEKKFVKKSVRIGFYSLIFVPCSLLILFVTVKRLFLELDAPEEHNKFQV